MRNILVLLTFICLVNHALLRENTKSLQLIEKFKITRLIDGDDMNFPEDGDTVTVHYTGFFPESGDVFDSSHSRKETLDFILGDGFVINCWDIVLEKMSKGEKIKLICPSELAYGKGGAGSIIPPNADLGFEIELIDFTRKVVQQEVPKPTVEHQDL